LLLGTNITIVCSTIEMQVTFDMQLCFLCYYCCWDCNDLLDTTIGILTVITEDTVPSTHSRHLESAATAIVLEGAVVMDDLDNVPHSMCLLFGLIYKLNLEYPQQLRNTFEFIERVVCSLGPKQPKNSNIFLISDENDFDFIKVEEVHVKNNTLWFTMLIFFCNLIACFIVVFENKLGMFFKLL